MMAMMVVIRTVRESFQVLSAIVARALLSSAPALASCASETPFLTSVSWLQKDRTLEICR